MIHPTRTNLLMLKDKARSVTGSIGILKARRLALIREFLATSAPFLRTRDEVKAAYARALAELRLSLGHEGEEFIASLEGVTGRELAEGLRKDRAGLKVVFMSGYSTEAVGKDTEFFRRTRSHFLQKPCSPGTLLQTVRQCLDEK